MGVLTAAALAALILGLLHLWASDILAWIGSATTNLIGASLRIEKALPPDGGGAILSAQLVERLFSLCYDIACGLLLLKFIWKGIQIYILWRDGDADVSPMQMLTGAILAVVICAGFPTIYNAATRITVWAGDQIVQVIDPDRSIPTISQADLYNEAYEKFDAYPSIRNGAAGLSIRDWFPMLDADGDGLLTEAEMLPHFDRNHDGRLDGNELNQYYSTVWGIQPSEEVMAQHDCDYNGDGTLQGYELDEYYRQIGESGGDGYLEVTRRSFSSSSKREGTHPMVISRAQYAQWYAGSRTAGFEDRVHAMNWFEVLFVYIYGGAFILLWLRLMARGFEMLVLRVGLPLAALGLIDSDGGVFKNYTQLMLRQMLTSVFQASALRLSAMFVFDMSLLSLMISISILMAAFHAPQLLQQIMTPQKVGGQGLGSKLYQGAMIWRMLKR